MRGVHYWRFDCRYFHYSHNLNLCNLFIFIVVNFNCLGRRRHAGQAEKAQEQGQGQARLEKLASRVDSLIGSVNRLIAEGRGMQVRIKHLEEVSRPNTAPVYRVSYYNLRLIIFQIKYIFHNFFKYS